MEPKSTLSNLEKIFIKLAPVLIAVAAVLLVITIAQLGKTSYAVKQTSAYTRVSNCIVAKLAGATIPQDEIEKCYVQVEKQTNVPLERFDMQTHNEN